VAYVSIQSLQGGMVLIMYQLKPQLPFSIQLLFLFGKFSIQLWWTVTT
jgi:hypothetical protein